MKMRLRLYHYWRSSSSWRVRWGFALKNIECEFQPVDLLRDESETTAHKLMNPMGFVPVLEFLGSDVGPDSKPATRPGVKPIRFLAESMAILEWAEEMVPEPALLPGSALDRARIRQLAELVNSGTQPLQNPGVASRHSTQPDEQKEWNRFWIHKGLEAYEILVGETMGQYSFGDQVTLADLFLVPQVFNALRYKVSMQEFPRIRSIYDLATKTPAAISSAPAI